MKPNEWLFDAIGCVEDSLVFLNQPSVDSNNLLGKGNIFYPTDLNRGCLQSMGKWQYA